MVARRRSYSYVIFIDSLLFCPCTGTHGGFSLMMMGFRTRFSRGIAMVVIFSPGTHINLMVAGFVKLVALFQNGLGIL